LKSNKINYLLVGGFVIAMTGALVVVTAVLSGRTGATDAYFSIYKNVTGVKFGTQVLYEGYPIGQVEKITPMAEKGAMRFRVDMTVREGWMIPDDSVASIRAPGLLSAITIAIDAGASQTSHKPGAEIKGQDAANLFAVMSTVASDLGSLADTHLRPLLISLDRTVNMMGNLLEKDGERLVGEIVNLVHDVGQRVPKIAGDIEVFAAEMSKASKEITAFLSPANRAAMEDMIANLDAASKDLHSVSGKTNLLLDNTNKMVSDGNRQKVEATLTDVRHVTESLARHIDSINQNLEGTARNMYEFSREIRQNPGRLLGGSAPQDEAAQGGGRR
jgi:phospholipid/cholesterol/gamma-HCH transport system substrate-binding protein